MKRNPITEKYIISDRVPTSLAVTKTSLANFVTTIETFFERNFDGIVSVTTNISKQNLDCINICAEQVAYFFKLLILSMKSEAPLNIDMSCDDENKFVVNIESDAFADMSKSELYEIARAARAAKFTPYEAPGAIILKRTFKTSLAYRIYATSPSALADAFNKIFFDGKENL